MLTRLALMGFGIGWSMMFFTEHRCIRSSRVGRMGRNASHATMPQTRTKTISKT